MTEMQVVTEDSEWQLVSLDQLKVTTGKREVQQTASGFLSLNSAKTRALLTAGYQRHVLLQFRYRGQTPNPEPNQSGEIVEQIGIKLRTLNTSNVLYVMWRITPPEGIVVKLKRNPGQCHHKECGAIAAVTRHLKSRSRIVIVTPGPDLNSKWHGEFSRFREMFDFGEKVKAVRHLSEFVEAVRQHPVVIAPVTMFQSGRGSGAQLYLLSLYFYWKKLHGNLHGHTANAILARFRDGEQERVDVRTALFLDAFDLEALEPHLEKAFRRGRAGGAAGLDDLYEKDGLAAFENVRAVRNALYRARFVLTGRLMPMIDLLIVDEAHKLKNPGSLRTQAMA